MGLLLHEAVQSINDWAKTNGSKIFRDSFGTPFRIAGAEIRTKAGNEYIVFHIMHQNGKKTTRPLSAFHYQNKSIHPNEIITILNTQTLIEGKSTFDITDKINVWIKKNPYKFFTDRSGVQYYISGIASPDSLYLTSKAGNVIEKKIASLSFEKENLNDKNIYNILSNATHIDGQIFYGNIVDHINKWAKENSDKWFQNGTTGKFRIIGAKSQNGITLLIAENDSNIIKHVALNKFVFENRKMSIGNAIEFLTLCDKFDNTLRFGDEIEIANNWLKENNPTFTDKNGVCFKIDKVYRDKDSQIKFQVTNESGKTVSRNAYSFIRNNGIQIQDGNIVAFLQNAQQFDNAIIFENAWQQGNIANHETSPHYLPDFTSLNTNSTFRLPNGQCAKVIEVNHKQTTSTKQKTIDLLLEDGTIIRGISQTRYNSGLFNINTNRPILNILPLSDKGYNIFNPAHAKAIRREFRQMIADNSTLGNRSNIEFKYFYYLEKLGFSISDPSFFEKNFGIRDRRLPDSYLLKNNKMIIFEFDGGSGHGGVHHSIEEDMEKDKDKNAMYQQIIANAQKGKYLPKIEEVMVVRVRGNNVPLLNPENITEINYPKCTNEELMIPQVIVSMVQNIDAQTGLNLTSSLNKLYPNGINFKEDQNNLLDFVDEMVGKSHPNQDPRMGEISQMLGFGTSDNRTGQFIMIVKVEQKEKGIISDNDKVHVIFEDGRKTKTSYANFKNGTINDGKFNKVIDYSTRRPEYITLAQTKKQSDYAYSMSYYLTTAVPKVHQNNMRLSQKEIENVQHQFPIVDGLVQFGETYRPSLSSRLQQIGIHPKSVADNILDSESVSLPETTESVNQNFHKDNHEL